MLKNFFITAWRNLAKNKISTILNISGLAIGVTVCLLIAIWLQRELSFDNFHPNGKQIYRISNTFKSESESFSQAPSGPAFAAQLPKLLPAVKSACRYFRNENKIKAGNRQFFETSIGIVDSNFFSFFGYRLKKGSVTQCLLSPNNIVLSEKMATKYFGKEDPIGKTVVIDDRYPMIVTAVAENAPLNSQLQPDILVPVSYFKDIVSKWQLDLDNVWVGGWPYVYIQLDDHSNKDIVEQQVNEIAAKYSEKEWKENKMSYHYFLQSLTGIHLNSHLRYDNSNNGNLAQVNIFSIVGIIVLLLACINYINLTTAGAIRRARETSVRKVIGATKWQLIRQFFFETLIICSIAVCIGIILVKIILPFFSAWIGTTYSFPINVPALLGFLGFIILISLIAGIYPAVILSSFKPVLALKGNLSQNIKGSLIRKGLVVFQFSITIALIASILIINQQMNFIKHKSLGFNGNAVIVVDLNNDSSVLNHYAAIKNNLLKDPYILSVTRHGANVVGGLGNGWTTTENLKGEEVSTSIYRLDVDEDYLKTYDMKLAAGRFFSKDIPTDSTGAVLVNEAAVRTFGWQRPENAIGKRFGKDKNIRYVIGVIKDFNFENLHKSVEALLIGHARNYFSQLSVKVNAAHADEAIDHLKATWSSLAPDFPLQYAFVDEGISNQYGSEQKMEGIFYGFSALSLLIACFGLFGLTTFVVERKVKEIGIRKVLGASISGIVGLLSKDFLKLVFISILIASPLAWYFMNNWLQDFAYRVNIGWWVFIAAGCSALLITLMTVSIQAIKAAMTNPVKSLRTE